MTKIRFIFGTILLMSQQLSASIQSPAMDSEGVIRSVAYAPVGGKITGPIGASGPAGEPGTPGSLGAAGAMGPTGPKGATGNRGPAGPQGGKGPVGETGLQGEIGDVGLGDAGMPGAAGIAGTAGPKGPRGATGPRGAAGATGEMGTPGAKGETGPTGDQGPQGLDGVTGPTGETGDRGKECVHSFEATYPDSEFSTFGTTISTGTYIPFYSVNLSTSFGVTFSPPYSVNLLYKPSTNATHFLISYGTSFDLDGPEGMAVDLQLELDNVTLPYTNSTYVSGTDQKYGIFTKTSIVTVPPGQQGRLKLKNVGTTHLELNVNLNFQALDYVSLLTYITVVQLNNFE